MRPTGQAGSATCRARDQPCGLALARLAGATRPAVPVGWCDASGRVLAASDGTRAITEVTWASAEALAAAAADPVLRDVARRPAALAPPAPGAFQVVADHLPPS